MVKGFNMAIKPVATLTKNHIKQFLLNMIINKYRCNRIEGFCCIPLAIERSITTGCLLFMRNTDSIYDVSASVVYR